MDLAIETFELTRYFNDFCAVSRLALQVERGTFYGFLGPNGAGKSTTIKMLTGLLAPSAGQITVLGRDMLDPRQSLEAKRWMDAASEVRDKVLETGAERVDASRRLGNETLDRARSVKGRLSSGIAGRALRPRGGEDEERDEEG